MAAAAAAAAAVPFLGASPSSARTGGDGGSYLHHVREKEEEKKGGPFLGACAGLGEGVRCLIGGLRSDGPHSKTVGDKGTTRETPTDSLAHPDPPPPPWKTFWSHDYDSDSPPSSSEAFSRLSMPVIRTLPPSCGSPGYSYPEVQQPESRA
ncbi:unnamed protein product [Gadus morhua 'NCC']